MPNFELIEDEMLIRSLTEQVTFELCEPDDLRYAPGLGLMALQQEGCTYAVGFYATPPNWQGPAPTEMTSVTDLRDVPADEMNIGRQGKGVGTRLHSTLPALEGMPGHGPSGLYGLQIDPDVRLRDIRHDRDKTIVGQGLRIAHHAGRIIQTQIKGLDAVVDQIHRSYDDADVIVMNLAPNTVRRQKMKGVRDNPHTDSTVLIVRDPSLQFTRLGVVA